jgi:uncharacterized protein YjbJ (UPF0337 family)
MHKDQKAQVKGVGEQIKGKVKEEIGDITGNKSLEIEGKIEKNIGHVREDVGRALEQNRKEKL